MNCQLHKSDTNGFVATDRSWTSRIYHTDNAGLTHVRGGPNPDNHGFPGTSPGASFFSAYRMFDKDPLPFEGKLGMYWRNGGAKCSLPAGGEEEGLEGPIRPGDGVVHSYVWYYTWDAAAWE